LDDEWLTSQAFERAHRVLAAINTLSIYAKLRESNYPVREMDGEVDAARGEVIEFLGLLGEAVASARQDRDHIAFGADPRMGQLAQEVLSLQREQPSKSSVATTPLEEMRDLLASRDLQPLPLLINYLRDLRALLEEHAHADAVRMLGEL
jgi:hypothetical protein